jgi:hypothetical protein
VPARAQARYMTDRVPGADMRVLAGQGHICVIAPDAAMLVLSVSLTAQWPKFQTASVPRDASDT